jgi:hypothetical protein
MAARLLATSGPRARTGEEPALPERALTLAASLGAAKVALTALATGYGRLPIRDFARGLAPVLALELAPVADVVVCLRDRIDADELAVALPAASRG